MTRTFVSGISNQSEHAATVCSHITWMRSTRSAISWRSWASNSRSAHSCGSTLWTVQIEGTPLACISSMASRNRRCRTRRSCSSAASPRIGAVQLRWNTVRRCCAARMVAVKLRVLSTGIVTLRRARNRDHIISVIRVLPIIGVVADHQAFSARFLIIQPIEMGHEFLRRDGDSCAGRQQRQRPGRLAGRRRESPGPHRSGRRAPQPK